SDFRYHPTHLANRGNGSLGRTQSGHYALALWKEGGIGEKQVREGLDRLFREHRFIEIGRKRPMPHDGWDFTAGQYQHFRTLLRGEADRRAGGQGGLQGAAQVVHPPPPGARRLMVGLPSLRLWKALGDVVCGDVAVALPLSQRAETVSSTRGLTATAAACC